MNTLTVSIISGATMLAIAIFVKAFALKAAKGTVQLWVRCYTRGIKPGDRDSRRDEIASDLREQEKDARDEGYSPEAIALHILCRLILGIPADISWRLGQERDGVTNGRIVVTESDLVPAAQLDLGGMYCLTCQAKKEDPFKYMLALKNDRRALIGTCPTCSTKMFKIIPR